MTELKTSPFCGVTREYIERQAKETRDPVTWNWDHFKPVVVRDNLLTGKLFVQCQNCQATMLNPADSEEEAARYWNDRRERKES